LTHLLPRRHDCGLAQYCAERGARSSVKYAKVK